MLFHQKTLQLFGEIRVIGAWRCISFRFVWNTRTRTTFVVLMWVDDLTSYLKWVVKLAVLFSNRYWLLGFHLFSQIWDIVRWDGIELVREMDLSQYNYLFIFTYWLIFESLTKFGHPISHINSLIGHIWYLSTFLLTTL